MTSGTSLEKVDSPRSVGSFHGVRVYSRVFQGPSMAVERTVPRSVPGEDS
jgi:hypothetical protein